MGIERFTLSRFTLMFRIRGIERMFLKEHIAKSLFQCRMAVALGLVLYLLFGVLDFQLFGHAAALICLIRFVAVPIVFVIGFTLTFTHKQYLEFDIGVALSLAQVGHVILFLYGGAPNAYFYGVTIILVMFLFTFTRIRFRNACLFAFWLVASYEAAVIASGRVGFEEVLMGNYFLLSLAAVGGLAGYGSERYMRREFVQTRELAREQARSERLLLNILPGPVAEELKARGTTRPVRLDCVSVMFADFVAFSRESQDCGPGVLISSLDKYFSYFDQITAKYGLEKIKTIGDCYMVASGLPRPKPTHAVDCILAAMDFIEYVEMVRQTDQGGLLKLDIRIGIHVGPVISGVLGRRKFTYDIFGPTVNLAARMESSGAANRVNISRAVRDLVQDFFVCEARGLVELKHGEPAEMFWIAGIHPELALDSAGTLPGPGFIRLYSALEKSGPPV